MKYEEAVFEVLNNGEVVCVRTEETIEFAFGEIRRDL